MNPATAMPAAEINRPTAVAPTTRLGSESSRQILLDGLPGMAFLGHTDRHRTLDWVSDGGRNLLGLESSAPFEFAPLIHPEEREMVLDYVASAASDLQPFAVEYRVRHANGHWRTVWEQSRPLRRGHQIFLHGYIVDVTARVERDRARQAAEYERLQNQKTLALNKIAGCVLHEFNNIVHGVLSSADGLAMDLAPGHQAQESLKNIFAACNRAREFDQKVRALVQRPPLERKSISLAPVIEDCLDTLRSIVSDKVVITAQLAPGCPAVHADAASLQQTLMDLCLYAWQGLPERRGHLEISLAYHPRGGPANVNSLRPGPQLCLTVRDHGPGLDKNALEKTFDPFHLRKATGRQTGLEMFLARETIQAHQGEIIVESQPDQGTAFHIYLPVAGET